MSHQTMGEIISQARKKKGMTQKELAEYLNVTDKAVSKWERNRSCPDIGLIPVLAEILEISVEELLGAAGEERRVKKTVVLVDLILKCMSLALGICVVVLSALGELTIENAGPMLGLGLAGLALCLLRKGE